MVGEHISELKARTHTMTPEHIEQSRQAWLNAAGALKGVGTRLQQAAPRLLAGFGNSDIGNTASDTCQSAGGKILTRQEDLQAAAETLEPVYVAAFDAKLTAGNAVPVPGDRPTPTDITGTGMTPAEAMSHDAKQMRAYNQRVAALGAADEEARLALQALDSSYDDAAVVLAKIHGDLDVPGPGTRNDGTEGSGGGGVPVSAGSRPGQVPLHGPTSAHPAPHPPGHGTGTPPAITPAIAPADPGTPGSQTNRGAGGGRSGGRATGRGTGGATGGTTSKAGSRGSRGSGAGAGGQRGRKKSDEQDSQERQLSDDGQDWIDDEGAGPSVLH